MDIAHRHEAFERDGVRGGRCGRLSVVSCRLPRTSADTIEEHEGASSHGRHDASPCTSCLDRLDHSRAPDPQPDCDRIERRSPSRVTNSLPSRFPGQILLADQMSPGASVSLPVRASLLYTIRRSLSSRGANVSRGKERYSSGRTVRLIYRKHPSPGGSALLCQTFTGFLSTPLAFETISPSLRRERLLTSLVSVDRRFGRGCERHNLQNRSELKGWKLVASLCASSFGDEATLETKAWRQFSRFRIRPARRQKGD